MLVGVSRATGHLNIYERLPNAATFEETGVSCETAQSAPRLKIIEASDGPNPSLLEHSNQVVSQPCAPTAKLRSLVGVGGACPFA